MKMIEILIGIFFLLPSANAGNDSLDITFHGDTVFFRHVNAHSLCYAKFAFDILAGIDTITIVERDTSLEHIACRCGYQDLTVAVTGIKTGSYLINVFRQELMKYYYPADTLFPMCSSRLIIEDTGKSYIAFRSFQSECGGATISGPHVIYSTSFESPSDTAGWSGSLEFRHDAPAEGGERSAFVSGGCIWPHAWIDLDPLNESGFYILRCWGKDLGTGGSVSIEAEGDMFKKKIITVNKNEWRFYQTADSIFCPAGKKILLRMGAGGYAPSAMLVDRIEIVKCNTTVTAVAGQEKVKPGSFSFLQNYPNPFNPSTTILFTLPSATNVAVRIFDLLGREIATLVNGSMPAGTHHVEWNAASVISGVYVCRLESDKGFESRKLIVIR